MIKIGLALSQNEKHNIPKLGLHCSAQTLNSHIIQTHKSIKKTEKINKEIKQEEKQKKNKKLLEGLGITGKKEVEHKIIETKGATLANTKRIINFTEVGQSYTKTDLSKDLIIPSNVVEEILLFLSKYTNVKFKDIGGRYVRES